MTKVDEYRIVITGELTDAEFDQIDSKLDEIREAIEEEAEIIFNSKCPARLLDKLRIELVW